MIRLIKKKQMRKRVSVHDHGWGTYTFFLNLKTCFLNRSRAVDIPRYQQFCLTPKIREVTAMKSDILILEFKSETRCHSGPAGHEE